jgi:hypothetical protein
MSSEPPYVALKWGLGTEHYVGREIGAVLPVPGSSAASIFFAGEQVAPTSRGAGEPGGWRSGPALFLEDRERAYVITPLRSIVSGGSRRSGRLCGRSSRL